MTLPKEEGVSRIVSGIGRIYVTLYTSAEGEEGIDAKFEILDQHGEIMRYRELNIAPYLTGAQVNSLRSFMAGIRARAHSEMV